MKAAMVLCSTMTISCLSYLKIQILLSYTNSLFFNIYQEILRKLFEGNSQPWDQCCTKIRQGEHGQEWENLSMGNVWWPPKEKLSVGSECQIAIDLRVSGKVRTSCIVPINGLCLTSQSWNPPCPWETALLLAAL